MPAILAGGNVAERAQIWFALSAAALTVSCIPAPQNNTGQSDIPLVRTEGMYDFGDYVLYVNALTTDDLSAEVAGEYGIVRSNDRALLTLSVHRKAEDGSTAAVASEISTSASNLTGQLKNVFVREIREGDAIYYIGELEVADRETLTYNVTITPSGEDESLSVRYQKQFFTDQ